MRVISTVWIAAVLGGVASSELHAQGADTLRYREWTEGEMLIVTPQGEMPVGSEHDALIGFIKLSPDSAHAWYEEISVAAITPMAEQRPDISSVVNERFVLKFDAEGHVKALSTPDFPESLKGITDLRYQFVDFFMPVPAEPLRSGLSWSDTLVIDQSRSDGVTGETRKIAQYSVVADTVLGSEPVFVVESDAEYEVWTEGPVPNQPGLSMRMTLSGPEKNTYWIAKRGGHLMFRTRSGEMEGVMSYIGAPQPIELPVTRTYTNEIELIQDQDM